MPSRQRNRRDPSARKKRRQLPAESRAAEAVTVAWTVTTMTLVICELMLLLAFIYLRFEPQAGGARSLAALAHFASLILAVVSLAMLPAVYRVRRVPPPRTFVAFALVAAAVPFVVALREVFR